MADVYYKNISGSTVSVPTITPFDVVDDEVIAVPDDAVMPPEWFELQE